MGDRARGAFTASQVSAGRKNRLSIEIYGTKCGVAWDQERPDELWIGHRNSQQPDHHQGSVPAEAGGARLRRSAGRTQRRLRRHLQAGIPPLLSKGGGSSAPVEYPTFAEGLHGMKLLQKVIESNKKRGWVDTD